MCGVEGLGRFGGGSAEMGVKINEAGHNMRWWSVQSRGDLKMRIVQIALKGNESKIAVLEAHHW